MPEEMIQKQISFEIKSIDEEVGEFEALASAYDVVDSDGDLIERGAFAKEIRRIKKSGKFPKILIQHRRSDLGGIMTDIKETEAGPLIKGKFIDTQKSRDLRVEVKSGAITDVSVGFSIDLFEYDIKREIRIIKNIAKLWEVSFVTFPANDQANVLSVKSKPQTVRDFERLLKELGFSQKEAKTIISQGYPKDVVKDEHRDDACKQRDVELNDLLVKFIKQFG